MRLALLDEPKLASDAMGPLPPFLTQEERDRLKVDSTFDPFRRINSFYTNEYQTAAW